MEINHNAVTNCGSVELWHRCSGMTDSYSHFQRLIYTAANTRQIQIRNINTNTEYKYK